MLHEAINASLTKFYSSWWLLFIFVPFISLSYLGDFTGFVKPIIEGVDSKNAQSNLFVFLVVLYLFLTIAMPFLVCYFLSIKARK